jgi:hypothetical protein
VGGIEPTAWNESDRRHEIETSTPLTWFETYVPVAQHLGRERVNTRNLGVDRDLFRLYRGFGEFEPVEASMQSQSSNVQDRES